MRVTCIQMDMAFATPDENFAKAEALIREAAKAQDPDVILLPELWNTGFYPKEGLAALCDENGRRARRLLSRLCGELSVNIVGGSVAILEDGSPRNTALVFNRRGECVARYDKTHLFSFAGEQEHFQAGDALCTFRLDGVPCGLLICYDLRFPELARSLALRGIEMLFLPAQWPGRRIGHFNLLCEARAVENQMFVACCNSCGPDENGVGYGGNSALIDPLGKVLARAGHEPCFLTADCDLRITADTRAAMHIYKDRRPELYELSKK